MAGNQIIGLVVNLNGLSNKYIDKYTHCIVAIVVFIIIISKAVNCLRLVQSMPDGCDYSIQEYLISNSRECLNAKKTTSALVTSPTTRRGPA